MTPSATPPDDARVGPIPANFMDRLRAKRYVHDPDGFGSDAFNVLTLGFGERIKEIFAGCTLRSDVRGPNMRRRVWRCGGQQSSPGLGAPGGIDVQDLSDVKPGVAADEELELVATGQRHWGAEMRPSGWLSGTFGRQYGRDNQSFASVPHAILVSENASGGVQHVLRKNEAMRDAGEGVGALVTTVSVPRDVSVLRKSLKALFVDRAIAAREKRLYENGKSDGSQRCSENAKHTVAEAEKRARSAEQRAHAAEQRLADMATMPTPVVFVDMPPPPVYVATTPIPTSAPAPPPRPTVRLEDCQATLKTVLAQLDKCNADRQSAFDAGMAKGMDEEQRRR